VDNPGGTLNTSTVQGTLPNLACQNPGAVLTSLLGTVGDVATGGTYQGSATAGNPNLKYKTSSGTAICDTTGQGQAYALGNFLNYTLLPPPPVLVQGSDSLDYELIKSHTSGDASCNTNPDDKPNTGSVWSTYWKLKGAHSASTPAWQPCIPYDLGSETQQKLIYDAVKTVVDGARYAVKFGAEIYGSNNSGGKIIKEVKDISANADFTSFLSVLPGGSPGSPVLSSNTGRPQAEALYDAYQYFKGQPTYFANPSQTLPKPQTSNCEKLYVILLTNGLPNGENKIALASLIGDYDNDGREPDATGAAYGQGTHYLDDMAKKMYDVGIPYTNADGSTSNQHIVTHTVLAFQADDPLLKASADDQHGHGKYYVVSNASDLVKALNELINTIVLEADTSFVAPVVPVSPENRTYSGSRIFMGFFKPQSGKMWLGNVKKYGIDSNNVIVDKNGNPATAADGSFLANSISYWSADKDAGAVDSGGVGELLKDRNLTTDPRQIYTFLGTNTSLTASQNAFTVANADLTMAMLDAATPGEREDIIKFAHGFDVYDENPGKDNRTWILGDILHSKPLIVHYASYTDDTEGTAANKSMIYVGSNDGMLHAFRDYNGTEAWAFIPPDGSVHTYFVDSSPSVYIYDANKNGVIEGGDRVVIVFGERRGGGKDSAPTGGSYYALDVTDPLAPVFLWSVSNTKVQQGATATATTTYSELAETWSEPKIVKMKTSGNDKIVALVGAGYDNLNEDGRYGATQTFKSPSSVSYLDLGEGVTTSSGAVINPPNPLGRGVYAIEIASLTGDVPSFGGGGAKEWGYTSGMAFSVPSEITALDTDYDGYADRLYVGDTGGNMWRFDVGDPASRTGRIIFSANAGSDGTIGRKMFYRPAASPDTGFTWVDIGTGDREHPLNRAVVDRIYAIKDRNEATAKYESNMVDVTLNKIQVGSAAEADAVRTALSATSNYGWYIKLNTNAGEKVLASPTLFSGALYCTTYTPNAVTISDPCMPGNLGMGRLYALDYANGGAAIDFNGSGDLTTSDRSLSIGGGIPSGMVMIIGEDGEVSAIVAAGGNLLTPPTKASSNIKPLYWRIR